MANITSTSEKNRRNSHRKQVRPGAKIELRKGAFGFGKNLLVRVLDLSEGGMAAIIKEELALKSEVETILIGNGVTKPSKRIGTVCWSVPGEDGNFCVGISFDKRLAYSDAINFFKQ